MIQGKARIASCGLREEERSETVEEGIFHDGRR